MRKLIAVVFLFMIFMVPVSYADDNVAVIDDAMLANGIIKVSYTSTQPNIIKVMITKDGNKYTYGLKSDGTIESFPLQMGNGDYKIAILQNIGDSKYTQVTSKEVTLNLKDPNIVFLNSVQNINWTKTSKAIKKDVELVAKDTNTVSKLTKVYNYVIKNYKYDYDKIKTLKSDYVPQIDPIYDQKKGICYDYSAVFASMKRYEGLPVKLVKGYTKNVDGYHAWNEVYINGKWEVIDSTYDAVMYGAKAKYKMFKPAGDYQKVNEY